MYLNSYLYVSEKLKQNNLKQQSNNAYTVFKSAQMTLNALNVCSNFPHLKETRCNTIKTTINFTYIPYDSVRQLHSVITSPHLTFTFSHVQEGREQWHNCTTAPTTPPKDPDVQPTTGALVPGGCVFYTAGYTGRTIRARGSKSFDWSVWVRFSCYHPLHVAFCPSWRGICTAVILPHVCRVRTTVNVQHGRVGSTRHFTTK